MPHDQGKLSQLPVPVIQGYCIMKLFYSSPTAPSASVERVFSILRRHCTQYQNSALQDYVEVGVMFEFNNSEEFCLHYKVLMLQNCHYAQL